MSRDLDLSGIQLRKGDSFKQMTLLPDSCVQLTVTSPPYNIGKEYERKKSLDKYLEQFRPLVEQLYRVTNENGSVCWQVGNYVSGGSIVPLDIPFFSLFQDAGFQLKNRIVWHFRHGLHARARFSGRYETIMWFSKGSNPVFNLDPVRIPALYPGKRAFKGPRKGMPTGHPGGKNPSDFWPEVLLEDWESAIWDLPNVKANHPEKTSHPCQFPIELVERCLLALTNPVDLVLDPFLGVGSSAIAAERHGRRFIGFELEPEYLVAARRRLVLARKGKLPTRKLGTPIAAPKGRVSEMPAEWLDHA